MARRLQSRKSMPLRVLVAEDDPAMLETVAAAVGATGADVTTAASGAELVQLLAEEGPFDLVVTDVAMPWMSGIQVSLAARNAGLQMPIIVMTAMRDEKVARQVATLGHSAILLHKPFGLGELESAMQRVLART